MDTFDIRPAGPGDWAAIDLVLGEPGDRGCWCQAWRGVEIRGESRPDALRRQLATFEVPPGFIAWHDGEPVGWCGVALRSQAPRLAAGRTIQAIDDAPVWAIGCFRVRTGYRRRGVATALLEAVVGAARAAGAPGIEAYPIDPGGTRVGPGAAFVGLAPMFDRAGFRRVAVTGGHSGGLPRLLMRRDFDAAAG